MVLPINEHPDTVLLREIQSRIDDFIEFINSRMNVVVHKEVFEQAIATLEAHKQEIVNEINDYNGTSDTFQVSLAGHGSY